MHTQIQACTYRGLYFRKQMHFKWSEWYTVTDDWFYFLLLIIYILELDICECVCVRER
jgi:hypothetical protein